jgi:hypothetical protein
MDGMDGMDGMGAMGGEGEGNGAPLLPSLALSFPPSHAFEQSARRIYSLKRNNRKEDHTVRGVWGGWAWMGVDGGVGRGIYPMELSTVFRIPPINKVTLMFRKDMKTAFDWKGEAETTSVLLFTRRWGGGRCSKKKARERKRKRDTICNTIEEDV